MTINKNDNALLPLRQELNDIDRQILRMVAQRLQVIRKIAAIKLQLGLDLHYPQIEAQTLARATSLAQELGMDADFARCLQQLLMDEGLSLQKQLQSK